MWCVISNKSFYKNGSKHVKCQCKKCHKVFDKKLESIIDGKCRFCPCHYYIKINKNQRGKHIDLTGKRYNKLLVLKLDEERYYTRKQLYWFCKCDCGKIKSMRACSLKKSKSCGCIQKQTARENGKKYRLPDKQKIINDLYSNYRRSAKERNIEFKLSKEEFSNIIFKKCFYCNFECSNTIRRSRDTKTFKYNGIDRINSDLGYELENVVPACKQCNYSKSDYTKKEFLDWIKQVYEFNFKG